MNLFKTLFFSALFISSFNIMSAEVRVFPGSMTCNPMSKHYNLNPNAMCYRNVAFVKAGEEFTTSGFYGNDKTEYFSDPIYDESFLSLQKRTFKRDFDWDHYDENGHGDQDITFKALKPGVTKVSNNNDNSITIIIE